MIHAHLFTPERHEGTTTTTEFSRCRCGLRERRRRLEGKLYEVRYQLPASHDWLELRALLQFIPPTRPCPACAGDPAYGPCRRCNSLGILDLDNQRLT